MIVPKRDIVVEMGYPKYSKSVEFWRPKWRESWHIPEGMNNNNNGAHAFVGSDYCLYNANVLTQYRVFSTLSCILFLHFPLPPTGWNKKMNLPLTFGM